MPKPCSKGHAFEMLNRIPDDEPVFILRAQDRLAAETVAYWIWLAKCRGVNADKIRHAQLEHLEEMWVFQRSNPHRMKLPD